MLRKTMLVSATMLLAVALVCGVGPAHAQEEGGQKMKKVKKKPAYQKNWEAAMKTARKGVSSEKAGDADKAVEAYEQAYKEMAKVAENAQAAGSVENATKAKRYAAQFAYRAGRIRYKDKQMEEAIRHFEFGKKVSPPGFTKNQQGLQAVRGAQKQGPVVAASQALSQGNARKALDVLSDVEEETGSVWFYRAIAYRELGNMKAALSASSQALQAGGISGSKEGQLYLTMGEAHMQNGNDEEARQALQRATQVGGSQTSQRAQALLEQI